MAMGGQWQRGAALLDRAIALNPGGAGYYHGTRALAAHMLGDHPAAVAGIRQADLQKFPLFHAVASVIYAEAGVLHEPGERARRSCGGARISFQTSGRVHDEKSPAKGPAPSGLGTSKAGFSIPDGVEASIAAAEAADAKSR